MRRLAPLALAAVLLCLPSPGTAASTVETLHAIVTVTSGQYTLVGQLAGGSGAVVVGQLPFVVSGGAGLYRGQVPACPDCGEFQTFDAVLMPPGAVRGFAARIVWAPEGEGTIEGNIVNA